MGQGAGVPARSERLRRGPSVGKVGAGDRRGEHYLSVYLRVPPAPIARRSEPVAGRVATRSGCPLFCCQEGAKRARGIGAWGGQVGTGTAGFPSRMGGGCCRTCFGAPAPHREGTALDKPFCHHSLIHSCIYSSTYTKKGQIIQRWKEVYFHHGVLLEASLLLPPHPHPYLWLLSKMDDHWTRSLGIMKESWGWVT